MKRAGFTLIELLIVVAIIGILAAIAVPNFLNAQTRAKVSRVVADFRNLSTAIEQYRMDNNDYMPYPEWGGHTTLKYLDALSTPVAYISSAESIWDPFRHKGQADADGIMKKRYGYFDPTSEPVAWFIPGSIYRGTELPGSFKWCLDSLGPDNLQGVEGSYVTSIGHPGAAGFIVYEPSNGLTSYGDIYRFGP